MNSPLNRGFIEKKGYSRTEPEVLSQLEVRRKKAREETEKSPVK